MPKIQFFLLTSKLLRNPLPHQIWAQLALFNSTLIKILGSLFQFLIFFFLSKWLTQDQSHFLPESPFLHVQKGVANNIYLRGLFVKSLSDINQEKST